MGYNKGLHGYQSALIRIHQISDWISIALAAYLASYYVTGQFSLSASTTATGLIMLLFAVFLFRPIGMYRPWRGEKKSRELATMLVAWSTVFILGVVASYAIGLLAAKDRELLICWFVIGSVACSINRLVVRIALNWVRERGYNIKEIIIVGDDEITQAVIRRIRQSKWTGYRVIGYFGDDDLDMPVKRLGSYNDLKEYMEAHPGIAEQVWIALPLSDALVVQEIAAQLELTTVDIRYIPGFDGFNLINHSVSMVSGMPVVNLSSSPMYGFNRIIKAVEDRVLAFMILLMISPIMLALAIGVKLSSPGPIFYRQERVGWNGNPFYMLKFRSMPVNTEVNGVQWGNAKSKANTRFGKFIRATSLDELPQFINVLLGDMSIVGPRPERTVFVEEFKTQIPGYMKKHMVKAGITGWAQINGWRGDTDLNKRIECDLEYIENWSLVLDLKIIFLTLFKGFVHKNAA
ncbi:undecaprenyl-phosphate glucose phosphotransferase [Catenovulum sp. SX2]|uniref:undecaprenyl-phosphate glucose phosphotransferase n=1 Tax=Catenovulum sp. SX2 TaxID=3398614 RepID=UPI003F873EC7